MFSKLAVLTLGAGVVACMLLAMRQQRVQAAHELGDVQRRVSEHDRTLWRLRVEIAVRTTPLSIETAAEEIARRNGMAGLVPIAPERYAELVRRESGELVETIALSGDVDR